MNAILAGQLWPQPVLDFYLDHLVLEGGDEDEEEETPEDWLEQIFEGLDLLDRGYKVINKSDCLYFNNGKVCFYFNFTCQKL